MYTKGKIVSWDEQKGYGFAQVKASGVQIFVHQSECQSAGYTFALHQSIEFIISEEERGKPRAKSISILEGAIKKTKRPVAKWPLVCGLLFLFAIYYCVYLLMQPMLVALVYSFMSILTLILYAKDKRAARKGEWRVSEFTLQLTALLCGWPGAFIARVWLRHKTKKFGFSVVLFSVALLNMAALSWFFTEQGQVLIFSFAINLSFYLSQTGLFDVFKVLTWKAEYYLKQW